MPKIESRILQSVDGEEPVIESVAPEIIEHPDEGLLNPEDFRIDESDVDQPVVKTELTAIAIRKPEPLEFIMVHPDPEYRFGPVPFIALKQNREYYLVKKELRPHLRPREYWMGQIFLATNRFDKPFFWIVTTQSSTGRVCDWYTSALECAERAMHEWVQIVADMHAGVYLPGPAEEVLEEPEWPKQTFSELFRIGFKRRTVDSLEHPIFKQLRGRA